MGKVQLIIRAAYTDKSAKGSEAITTEEVKILRSPAIKSGYGRYDLPRRSKSADHVCCFAQYHSKGKWIYRI